MSQPTYWEANFRRKVFHQYPNGAMSIIGLLSLMKTEAVPTPEFTWWEERFRRQYTTTLSQGTTLGPFRLDADAADGVDPFLPVVNTAFTLYVASNEMFRVGHVVMITGLTVAAVAVGAMRCVVTSIVGTTKIHMRAISLPAGISTGFDNGVTNENVGKGVLAIGTAFGQGVVNLTSEVFYLPDSFGNNTQIFRTPFSFTRNAMKTPTKFDESSVYREKAKQHSLYHMVEMERAFLWGEKAKFTPAGIADPSTGAGLPEYKTGGLVGWFLPQWEIVNSTYRGGAGAPALTLDSEDDKRIITNAGGTMNEATYDDYLERMFRKTNNVTNERLAVCGNGLLKVVNQMYRKLGTLPLEVPTQEAFGMRIVRHDAPFGSVYYKTHPLFNEDKTGVATELFRAGLFLDVHNLRYRPVSDSDTFLRRGIQTPSMDGRTDEWLSDAGLQMMFPEAFLFLQNVNAYVP
jgi:hypothetical protein